MILFPPCKINLGLHILNKRADGYHNLDTLMYQIPFTDVLEIMPSEDFSFVSTGLQIPGDAGSNLCVQAFRLMQEKYKIPNIRIHLHKIIPMGGGMGGGSADGAYTLLGIDRLFSLGLSRETLQELAAGLGSDCPLFIVPEPQIAQGRGEILSQFPIDLSGLYLKLVNTGIHVSTKEAFSKVNFQDHPHAVAEIVSQPIESWKGLLINDFEHSVFQYHPELETVKQKLCSEGAIYASMTGSGSTMFAIYGQKPALSFGKEVFEKVLTL